MSKLADKLAFRRELPRHLRELSLLLGRSVDTLDLLSIDDTKELRSQANQVTREPASTFQIPFDATREPRFGMFVRRLEEANTSPVYVWTPASNACGLLKPTPLGVVRMEFPFDLNPEGIVAILTSDLQDELLLDYSKGDRDQRELEVEASGKHWGLIAY